MSDARLFNIVFQGRIEQGAAPEQVRANLARLFRITPEKVEALFSGQRVVLKKEADQATTMKFRAALKQAGALCEVEPVPGPPSVPARSGTEEEGDLQTVGTVRTGGTGFRGPFEVAALGAGMARQSPPPPPAPDTSHLSLAPPGTELEELPRPTAATVPEVGHLTLAPAGEDLGGG